ncbi:CHAD domain-containing protein [Dulcicalothrix desertica PCC 7102]|uniref:CHAD domain-containing protein n=1 Tax=Dulcicalothrix desertica PCC 7102 TaxID=232991 RepID=A0A433V6S1_9CYAN|nr:CHAD domain-containing protein [Dulcicalothrix desertica]RUT01800.1 CHAD domain-containing protein [Dulcicalothrix desertica PCC 7102]TWH42952.1 CHAD domain-containing protein [Dulcicalothrix desertica PCC 7102]
MTLATQTVVKTLGDYAYQAIQKHFKKTLKWEKTVKKDEDPEALHQMRVGMRRLRTVVSRFGFVVNLPKAVTDRNIGKIARRLGNLRDLDVLKESVVKNFQPHLPPEELKHLEKAFNAIDKQREQALTDVKATLKDGRYKSLKTSLDHWLEEPRYQESAPLSIDLVLPDLLLPEVSYFFLHPGWQFGTPLGSNNGVSTSTSLLRSYPKGMTSTDVEQSLNSNHEVLHSLRKQAKRLRYQMELFTEFYGETYAEHLIEVKNIQDILGEIHDSDVLEDWLVDVFGENFTEKLPTFTSLLVDKRHQLWQQWAPIQRRYTQLDTRNQLHLAILNPILKQLEDN